MRLIINAAMYCQVSDISRLSEDELRAEVDTKLGEIVNPLRYRQQSELQAGRLHVNGVRKNLQFKRFAYSQCEGSNNVNSIDFFQHEASVSNQHIEVKCTE